MLSEYVNELEKESKQKDKMLIKLNFNYRSIKSIDNLSQRYQFIKELYLNHNQIDSLKGIEQFACLEEFHIKFNYISSLDELDRIKNKSSLITLNLKGNPIEKNQKCCFDFLQNSFPNLNDLNENVRYTHNQIQQKENLNSQRSARSISYSNYNSRNKQKLISNASELSQVLENVILRQNSCSGLKSYRTTSRSNQQSFVNNAELLNEIKTERSDNQYTYNKPQQRTKQNGFETNRETLNTMRNNSSQSNIKQNQILNTDYSNIMTDRNSIQINQNQNNRNFQNIGMINQMLNTHSSRVNSLERQLKEQPNQYSNENLQIGSIQSKFNSQIQGFQSQLYQQANSINRPKSQSNYCSSQDISINQYQKNQKYITSQNQALQSNLQNSIPNMITEASHSTNDYKTGQNLIPQNQNSQPSSIYQSKNTCSQNQINSLYNTSNNYYQGNLSSVQQNLTNSQNATNTTNRMNKRDSILSIFDNKSLYNNINNILNQQKEGAVTEGNSMISFNQSKQHLFQQCQQQSFKKGQSKDVQYSNINHQLLNDNSLLILNQSNNNSQYTTDNYKNIQNNNQRNLVSTQSKTADNQKIFEENNTENDLKIVIDRQSAVQSKYTTRQQDIISQQHQIENNITSQYNSIKNNNDKQGVNTINLGQYSSSKNNQFNFQQQNQSISFLSNENYHMKPVNNRYGTNDEQRQQTIHHTDSLPIQTDVDSCKINEQISINNQIANDPCQQTQNDITEPIYTITSSEVIPITNSIQLNSNLQCQQNYVNQLQKRDLSQNESPFFKSIPNKLQNDTSNIMIKQNQNNKENQKAEGSYKFKKVQLDRQNLTSQNQKLFSNVQQSYNNYPLDTQNNPLDTDLSIDNHLVGSYNQNKSRRRAISQTVINQTNNQYQNTQSNQQLTSQNQFTQQSQQLQYNYNEMPSLNLSRISHINGKSLMNISIPHMKFDGGIFESQPNYQFDANFQTDPNFQIDDQTILNNNNNNNSGFNVDQSTQKMISIPQQRKSIIISEIVNQNKRQQQHQFNQTQLDGKNDTQRQSINQPLFLRNSMFCNQRITQHIDNIDTDIEQLAIFFYQKSLKERAFKALFYLKAVNQVEQKMKEQQQNQFKINQQFDNNPQSKRFNSNLKNSSHLISIKSPSPQTHLHLSSQQECNSRPRSNSSMNNLNSGNQSRQSPHPQIASPILQSNQQYAQNLKQSQKFSANRNSQVEFNINKDSNRNSIIEFNGFSNENSNKNSNMYVNQQDPQRQNNIQQINGILARQINDIPSNIQQINDNSLLRMNLNNFNNSYEDEMLLSHLNIQQQQNQSSFIQKPNQQSQFQEQFNQQQYTEYDNYNQINTIEKETIGDEISFQQVKQLNNDDIQKIQQNCQEINMNNSGQIVMNTYQNENEVTDQSQINQTQNGSFSCQKLDFNIRNEIQQTQYPNNQGILQEIKIPFQNMNEDKYQRLQVNTNMNQKNMIQQPLELNNNKRKELKDCNLPLSNEVYGFKKPRK